MRRLATLPWGLALLLLQPLYADSPTIRVVDFESMVNPITAMRITRAIDDAEAQGDELVLIRLDTPGGVVSSMEAIVKRMLSSEVPIAVWVGPSGAHAASAGFFILVAADVAAMAPGTRTGAAHTVMVGGENKEGDILLKKANEDLAALIRSIALRRGRDPEACEKAVFEAKAYEETVALEKGLVDLLADSEEQLLELLNGREITRFDGSKVVLATAGAERVISEFSLRHKFMEILALPIVAFGLLMLGVTGIYVELTNPGVVLPGVVGALSLLLFAISAQALPISAIGVLLIVLGAVMFILEIKVTSYGMLTLGGISCLLLGSWMLVDGPIPEMKVPFSVIVPTTLTIALFFGVAVHLAAKAQRERLASGSEGLTAEIGTAASGLEPDGKVFVHGELWDATSEHGPIAKGSRVRILRVQRMRLFVTALDQPGADRS